MSVEVADLYVVLRSVSDPFSKGLKAAAGDAESQSRRMSTALAGVAKVGVGLGVAVAAVAVESVKMASTFNAQMALLQTQAGVGKAQMAGLTDGVLALAGQVGFAPTSLAEALFHVESSFASVGITGPKALNLLKIAAEGAAVGHANLVDVTNALDAAVVSGIPGVQDMSSAMGVLNATVGAGDMTMQDLANAFSTGLLATVKGYGLSITDVGAALAVFGDNNIRGAVAATDLRMAVQALAVPAKGGASELAKLGLTADTLKKDLQTGGLLPALEDLKKHMVDAGVTTKEQGAVITELFGKKAGTGLNVLIDQLDRVKSKYPDLEKGASGFADAWATTKATFAQQMKEIRAEADATAVRLGDFLLPQLSKLLSGAQSGLGQVLSGFSGAATKPVGHDNLHNALLNRDAATPPPLTGWQRFGEETHRVLVDLERDAKKLEPVGQDFVRFGQDAWQALGKIVQAGEPVAKLLGGALLLGVEAVGKVLANVAGPALKDFADFLDSHQGMIKFFAEVIIGGLVTKMTILGALNAAQGIVGLATSIAQFPLGQAGQIGDAFKALKTAYTGKDAAEGEAALKGLKGAITDLKGSAAGALDKFPLFNSGKLASLEKAGQDIKKVEEAAAGSEQLGLFETNLKGIVQVADTEQLALFETDIAGVGTQAETSAASAGKLSGKLGKFALAGGMAAVLVGVGLLADQFGKFMGVGDHTGVAMDTLQTKLQLAGSGSMQARAQFTQAAVALVGMDTAMGTMGMHAQGLKDVDTALSGLVTGGHAQQAKDQFNDIAAALAKQGIDAKTAASDFPQYTQAIKDAGLAAQTTDGQLSGMQATLAAQQSLTTYTSDLATLKTQLQASGTSMDATTQAGQQNQQMFETLAGDVLNYYQQQRNAGKGTDDATNDMFKQVQQVEALGHQFGISKGAVDKFLGSLAGIKPTYTTTVNVDTSHAVTALNGLLQRIDNSSGTVQIYASPSNPTGGKAYTYGDGGWVKGGARGSAQPALVHVGEYIVSEDMQAGRAPIDPKVLSGMGGARAGSAGYVPGFGAGGTTVVNNYFVTNVAGSVLGHIELENRILELAQQHKLRNSSTGMN